MKKSITKKNITKRLKKVDSNLAWLVALAAILFTSCNKLDVNEDDFNHSHLTSFEGMGRLMDVDPVPLETIKKLFSERGMEGEELNYALENETYFYSWQSKGNFSEFVIYTKDGCENDLIYFIYDGAKYVDSKIISSLSDCGDFTAVQDGTIDDRVFNFIYREKAMGDLYENQSLETCIINEKGRFECGELIGIHPGLSLWNGLALRETPEKEGKFKASVNMGETFRTADSVEISEEDEYVFVELKGGTSGYILNRLVMQKAVPMAITYNATIYSRPDELTRTDKSFSRMDIVGVSESSGIYEWFKVKGRSPGDEWFKEGWIKADLGTMNPIDIAVASLVNRALEEPSEEKRTQMLLEIRDNPDFRAGYLTNHVSNFLPGM